jgi:GNAT superfamily N-acetyltransferase
MSENAFERNGIVIINTRPEDAADCHEIQRAAYPTLAIESLFTPQHVLNSIKIFPDGQFVAIDTATGRAVGMCSGILMHWEQAADPSQSFDDVISHGWLSRHNPYGHYYYGVDISIAPSHRGRGIARLLYDARKNFCRLFNRKGIVFGGIMPGYAQHRHALSAQQYVDQVRTGALSDPTLTVQLRNGFEAHFLIPSYFNDPPTDGWACFMSWHNPDYADARQVVATHPLARELFATAEQMAHAARPR